MSKQENTHVLASALFKLVPTILISAYLWWLYGSSVSVLRSDISLDIIAFVGGMTVAFFLYAYRWRFSVTFLLLVAVLFGIYRYINGLDGGEFDSYFYALSFFRFALFLTGGWLVGFGFARFRGFPWLAALGVFLAGISILVNDFLGIQSQAGAAYIRWFTENLMPGGGIVYQLFTAIYLIFLPILFYALYVVSINEILNKLPHLDGKRIWYLLRRSLIFTTVLLLIMLAPLIYLYFFGLPKALEQQVAQASANSADFLKKTYNQGTSKPEFDLQTYAQLLPEVKLSDETVFATYIDNFFPMRDGSQMPLPVHMRRFVLNRYEPENERFVLDPYPPSAIPNDLFTPDIKNLPVGFAISDSVIESATAAYQNRRDISSTVYIQSLAPDAYVAPNTGYSYQKLPVPREDRETFTSVYQCSSLISIWNLPPFLYSSNQPELVQFRDQRAQALRSAGNYSGLDSGFMAYYTDIDRNDSLIINLANQLTGDKKTPYDKVDAIVDYFTGFEEDGNRRFTYTLEPGAPADPKQSFMHYFLFENKRGYCTYFAGATTLLLRAAGIPCRVVVGYAIYDRSNKNTGWYWVYADQGHAWVEVYFPGYGWIDFDTTPSDNENAGVSPPKPDAPPPQFAREPVMAVIGELTGINADSTQLLVRPYTLRFQNQDFKIPEKEAPVLAIKPPDAKVIVEGDTVKIGQFPLRGTMVVSAYSLDYGIGKLRKYRGKPAFSEWMTRYFPEVIPVEEARVEYRDAPEEEGRVFAVEGRVKGLLPDSSGLLVEARKIFYRNRDYRPDVKRLGDLALRPEDGEITVDGEKMEMGDFAPGDSMRFEAES
ncbi:MAG TPA: transglutaminase domain-containing protein, partial [Calditrichia bacterium]|nr:transglutaminase domain-containing protein [Calditrichia bacterium]